jgi:superfamily II DNA/RNA helicase
VQDLKPENDAKLKRLLELLEQAPLKDQKVLIFTEFATTANYIGEEISNRFPKADFVSGASKDVLEKVRRFAPKANRAKVIAADQLRVLVSTDILAEGLNLQDCNVVVSYDLHWNPVRLIQRIGRVDRVSTAHEEIHTLNFFPEAKAEAQLNLEARLTKRFNDIHKHLGLDAKYLSQAEQLSDVKLFKRIYTGDASALDEPEEDAEVSFAELIKLLRDLRKANPVMYERIASLPDKMRSARRADLDELVVFCKHSEFAMLYLADNTGKVSSQDQMDILKKLRCEPNTKALPLPAGFNAKVREVEQQFKEAAAVRLAERRASSSEPIVRQTIKKLNAIAKKVTGADKATVSEIRSRLDDPISPQQRGKLRSILRQTDTPADTVAELKKLLLSQQSLKFADEQAGKPSAEPLVIHIIASEALIS